MAKNSAGSDPLRRESKFLSLVLRHDPGAAGVHLDEHGWVDIGELLAGMATAGVPLSSAELERIVAEDSKSRYAVANGRIRANQGHSVDVDLGLSAVAPPTVLFHGTARRFLESILATGINSGDRQHVHLSAEWATAVSVGRRHGDAVVLRIDAAGLVETGQAFFVSDNGVWLTSTIDPAYFTVVNDESADR